MENTKIIRIAALTILIISIITSFLGSYERSLIPNEITQAIDVLNLDYRTNINTLTTLLGIFLFVLFYLGTIGVIFKITWSKLMFTIPAITIHLLHPFYGPSIFPPWTATLDSINLLLSGFVIAMLYFSDNEYINKNRAS